MNLKQLEAFVQVAEGGSFSKAAKTLFLTQPTISAHIASLEGEFGVRLFVRNTKEVSLSEAGQRLYKYARQMVDLEGRIEELFHMEESTVSHSLTIAASTIPSQYLVPQILTIFKEKYPAEQIRLEQTDSAGVVKKIIEQTADIGFTGTVLEKKHCTYIPFYKDRLVIVTPNTPKYRAITKERTDILWLKDEQVIFREEGSGTRKEAEKQLKKAGILPAQLNIVACMDNQETIKRSVRQGMGVSVLSELATADEVRDGKLLTFQIPYADGRDINVAYNKNRTLTQGAEHFIRTVKEFYNLK